MNFHGDDKDIRASRRGRQPTPIDRYAHVELGSCLGHGAGVRIPRAAAETSERDRVEIIDQPAAKRSQRLGLGSRVGEDGEFSVPTVPMPV